MKALEKIVLILSLMTLAFVMVCCTTLAERQTKPRGSQPVITHSFASEKLSHNEKWKIYLEANDPDGDMRQIVADVGRRRSRSRFNYVGIKEGDRAKLFGYLDCMIWSGIGTERNEWDELTLTLSIRDKGGNTSNRVVFPLALSQEVKQGSPPPAFEAGGLKKLGTIWVDLAIRPPRE
jgi:hypothetical protein